MGHRSPKKVLLNLPWEPLFLGLRFYYGNKRKAKAWAAFHQTKKIWNSDMQQYNPFYCTALLKPGPSLLPCRSRSTDGLPKGAKKYFFRAAGFFRKISARIFLKSGLLGAASHLLTGQLRFSAQ